MKGIIVLMEIDQEMDMTEHVTVTLPLTKSVNLHQMRMVIHQEIFMKYQL